METTTLDDLDRLNRSEYMLGKRRAYLSWILAKAMSAGPPDALADLKRRLGDRSPHLDLLTKAAVAPNESSPDWDGVRSFADHFLAFVRPATLIGMLGASLRRVPVNVPILVEAGGTTATFVGHGSPTPV